MHFSKIEHNFLIICALVIPFLLITSCKHELLEDPGNGGGTNPPDTTIVYPPDTTSGDTCDPNLIYFELEVLPILQSNCAFSGCHDAASAQDGVILTDYANVMSTAKVRPFDLSDSELYEVLVDSDPDDRMPPPPSNGLSAAQINLIAQWILQGADNLTCDPNSSGCDTTDVRYSTTIKPIMQLKCTGCHSGGSPSAGLDLTTYASMAAIALNGKLIGVVDHLPGYSPMPKGGNKLPECEVSQIRAWIQAGAPNN